MRKVGEGSEKVRAGVVVATENEIAEERTKEGRPVWRGMREKERDRLCGIDMEGTRKGGEVGVEVRGKGVGKRVKGSG